MQEALNRALSHPDVQPVYAELMWLAKICQVARKPGEPETPDALARRQQLLDEILAASDSLDDDTFWLKEVFATLELGNSTHARLLTWAVRTVDRLTPLVAQHAPKLAEQLGLGSLFNLLAVCALDWCKAPDAVTRPTLQFKTFLPGDPLAMTPAERTKYFLRHSQLLDAFGPEGRRGRPRGTVTSHGKRTLDPERCEQALQMEERGKSHAEIAHALFKGSPFADPKTRERLRGQVRRYIVRGRMNRAKKRAPAPKNLDA